MSFQAKRRAGGPRDPFHRSNGRAHVLRDRRIRRAVAGAAVAVTLGGALLTLPGGAAPVKATDGAAIARVTQWVQHNAHVAYIDLVHEQQHGAALVKQRSALTTQDYDARREEIRHQMAADEHTLQHAQTILAQLATMRDQWFHDYAGTADSPILGPSKLTAEQMAAFVGSSRVHVHTTVPILDIARMYIEEGALEGVRGDVAFAQAIKETGDFSSSDAGKNNNFAGLGHCSACPQGDAFANARAGVRAQIELLRWLADPSVHSAADFQSQPATLPAQFMHNGHSHPTWTSLGGLWAPNPQYGASVYALYLRMHDFALSHGARTRG
jgi:hypothetical protein